MITIFSTCRSFKDERFNTIQRNAIGSWTRLNPKPQIIIMGDDPGSREICEEFNLEFTDNVELSDFGTPLVDSMISIAEDKGEYKTKLCISSDIILFQDMIKSIPVLEAFGEFLGVSVKLESKVDNMIDFEPGWETKVLKDAAHGPTTSGDFFLYSSGFWRTMPSFAVGRTHADSWMFCEGVKRKRLVNLTRCVKIAHQKHHHNHVPKGDPERKRNQILKQDFNADIRQSNWILDTDMVIKENVGRVRSKYD